MSLVGIDTKERISARFRKPPLGWIDRNSFIWFLSRSYLQCGLGLFTMTSGHTYGDTRETR
jgi:hypothetical protein